ncbi:MFS transporter [Oceanimonas pelagia]|uniref:MFS transporter n=1 Tax=Oceanimonas pelagia TaxID=3028314 RepID=A0AA50KLX6_9GAMM|nr:MFS transporter [Oceanimonas pelagia]WMC09958.1 MFS transporter [Oceanimonas pelagia]
MNPVLTAVLACHFMAAFSVLGMPLFLPRLLTEFGLGQTSPWVGTLYSLPAILTALSAPLWGRFADRYGCKLSLMRALAGLALAFALAGLAPSLGWFVLALALQGLFGGTLAAANGYLATGLSREKLAQALGWTQFTARLALVCAPIGLGLLVTTFSVRELYLGLTLLPLAALALAARLPDTDQGAGKLTDATEEATPPAHWRWTAMGLQFLFFFAMVATFPYFLPYAESLTTSPALIGLLYSLPHLVYLLVQPLAHRLALPWRPALAWGLGLQLLACLWQFQLHSLAALLAARLLFGLGIWLGFQGLNGLIGRLTRRRKAGSWFGRLDAVGKAAGVLAGLVAAWLSAGHGTHTPFIAAASACAGGLLLLTVFTMEAHNGNPAHPDRAPE